MKKSEAVKALLIGYQDNKSSIPTKEFFIVPRESEEDKDLGKAVWYLNDYKDHFIDYKNESTIIHKIPEEVITKMIAISDAEPREEIKHVFELLIMITTQNCVLDPKLYDRTGYELEQFANSL